MYGFYNEVFFCACKSEHLIDYSRNNASIFNFEGVCGNN